MNELEAAAWESHELFGVKPGIGGVEHLRPVERYPKDIRLPPLKENVLVVGVVHRKPLA